MSAVTAGEIQHSDVLFGEMFNFDLRGIRFGGRKKHMDRWRKAEKKDRKRWQLGWWVWGAEEAGCVETIQRGPTVVVSDRGMLPALILSMHTRSQTQTQGQTWGCVCASPANCAPPPIHPVTPQPLRTQSGISQQQAPGCLCRPPTELVTEISTYALLTLQRLQAKVEFEAVWIFS